MQVTIVLSTARDDRVSERVYKAIVKAFSQTLEATIQAVDIKDIVTAPHTTRLKDITADDERYVSLKQWQQIVTDTDALVFVIPEYNHGYPGEWKLLVDSLYVEYKNKHAYVVGVSNGPFAGVRVGDHVRPILVQLGLHAHKEGLFVSTAQDMLNEQGDVLDAELSERIVQFVETVVS